MKKFILISFGFLGWAFYEMSGGEDFEPASAKLARLQPEAEQPLPDDVKPVAVAGFVDTDPPLEPEVTRVSLNLATVEDILRQDTDIAAATQAALAEIDTSEDDTGVPRNVGTISESATTPAIIPSLLVPNTVDETAQRATPDPALTQDVRTVSGSRVNVRGGPGTDYGIVGRLVQGDAVEVLEDTGNGWVRMRSLDGEGEGWMADFLLTSG